MNMSNNGFYLIANNESKTLIARIDWYGQAHKKLEELNKIDNVHTVHNVTHPKCPKWIKILAQNQWFYSMFGAEV
jgi:hypothetical protein